MVLYDVGGTTTYPLDNVENFFITHTYGGFDTMCFDINPQHELYPFISEEIKIGYGDNIYLVKGINERKRVSTITCSLDLDIFKNRFYKIFRTETLSLHEVIQQILPLGWSIIEKAYISIKRTIELENVTDYDVLQKCMSVYSCVYEFSTANKTITLINPENTQNLGVYFTDELNLTDLNFKGSTSDHITRLYAYGKEGMTIADINDGKEYVEDLTYNNKVICGAWKDERYTIPENLKSAAEEKLKTLAYPVRSYQCTVMDLEKLSADYTFLEIHMYMTATLIDRSRRARVDHRIVEYKEYPEEREKNVVTLSTAAQKIEGKIHQIQGEVEEGQASIIQGYLDAIATATNLITGNSGGYVVLDPPQKPERILIMDNLDKSKAKNVWQFNQAGLGHSTNGINGPYDTAITMDGKIVASFILAGILKGIRIENGNGAFVVEEEGSVKITNGVIKLTQSNGNYIELSSAGAMAWKKNKQGTLVGRPFLSYAAFGTVQVPKNTTMTIGVPNNFPKDEAYYPILSIRRINNLAPLNYIYLDYTYTNTGISVTNRCEGTGAMADVFIDYFLVA